MHTVKKIVEYASYLYCVALNLLGISKFCGIYNVKTDYLNILFLLILFIFMMLGVLSTRIFYKKGIYESWTVIFYYIPYLFFAIIYPVILVLSANASLCASSFTF